MTPHDPLLAFRAEFPILADAQGFTNASEAGATLGDVFAGRFKDRS